MDKSKILILGSNAYVNQINYYDLPCISVNGINLPYVSEERNLGVWMISNLSWSRHLSCISKKDHGTLHALKYHKYSLSEEMRIKLVTALLLPHIDYCCLASHGLTGGLDKMLRKLVNLRMRFIYNLKQGEHTTPFRQRLNWLPVRNRRLYFLGILAYKVIHQTVPSYITELFFAPSAVPRHSERLLDHDVLFHIPIHRTMTYRSSSRLSAAYLWN